MKKKLFTLLTLALAVCSGAWGDEVQTTLFHWAYDNTSSVQTIANGTALTGVTGGALTPNTTNDSKAFSAKDKIKAYGSSVPSDMKAAGTANSDSYYLKNGSGALSLKVELTTGTFQAGDVVQICGTGNWNVSTTNNKGGSDGDVIAKIETGSTSDFVVASGTIPSTFTASNTLYFARQDGTTNGICAIKIVRSKTVNITSKELSGVKVNGTSWDISGINENAATISDEYAGPPTVQFIYTVNYDDNTSSTNNTENVVAVKSGTDYVATSTVLTTNVTLTFTNVSNVLFSMTNPTGPTEELASNGSSAVTATFSSGGSAIVYNGHGTNTAVMVDANGINLAGSGNSYFKASFPSALAEGDVIDCSNHNGTFYLWYSDSKSNSQTLPYTIPSGSDLIGKKTIFLKKNSANAFTWLTITRPKAIDTQEFDGIKKGETTLTETTDYTVSGSTITLADAYKALLAPTDIKLINHITYDDATTEDKDVDVTLVQNEDYFEGTADIGTTTYTVKVPVDASTPLLTLSDATGTINLNSYTPTGTAKVTVTGINLANGTFTAPTAEGVTVEPATVEITDGTLNQEFTITSTASTTASTILNFTYTGAEAQNYTLAYSKTAQNNLTQSTVSEATTWDWSKAGSNTIELKATTSPTNSEEFLMANLPEVNNNANFNSQALMIMAQYPTRGNNNYFQGYSIKFNTTVPGTIDVKFSNTGNKRPYRYLRVNGNLTSYKDGDGSLVDATNIAVPAGEVVIDFYIPDATDPQERSGDVVGTTMCRVNKIVFTPATATPVNLNASGYATYSTYYDVEVSGANAYTAALDFVNSTITCTKITDGKVPAGAGVLLYGNPNATVTLTPTTGAATLTGNNLKGTTQANGTLTNIDTNNYYVLSGNTFKKFTGEAFTANKAYFEVASGAVQARAFSIVFDKETTSISQVETTTESMDGSVYNLSGQRVSQPTKGLYIVNGKKFMVK